VPTNLEQLMRDASALGERLRRERLVCDKQPKADGAIKLLEQQLSQTWTAIRLARRPHPEVALPLTGGERSKWA
jgi:hypothetical protein